MTGLICCALFVIVPEDVSAEQEGDYTYDVVGSPSGAIITGYTGLGGDIVIPSTLGGYPVVEIGFFAFYEQNSLISVVIPDGVKVIGGHAFRDCSQLVRVIMPNSVTTIYEGAFYDDYNLIDVTMSSNVTQIDRVTFCYCYNLVNLSIPSGVTTIGDNAFEYCRKIVNLTIPSSAKTIGAYAYSSSSLSGNVTIPEGVTSVGKKAFSDCNSLFSINVPSKLIWIGEGAFSACGSLKSINVHPDNPSYNSSNGILYSKNRNILHQCPGKAAGEFNVPEGVELIDNLAFQYCDGITSVTFSSTVVEIGEYAFSYMDNLISIFVPSNVRSLGIFAFGGCSGLTSVTLSNGIVSIGEHAFYDTPISSIMIPASTTSLGGNIFAYCDNLVTISVATGNPLFSGVDGMLFNKEQTVLLECPEGKSGSVSVPYGTIRIGDDAFSQCYKITSIVLADSLTTIGNGSFSNCKFSSIDIPNNVTHIGYGAFSWCSDLEIISLSEKLVSIGDHAFYYSGLRTITIPDSVTYLGQYSFYNCYDLLSITLSTNLVSIQDGSFSYCHSLLTISIPQGVISIGNFAFASCTSLLSVELFEGLESIGERAFQDCHDLVTIVIPSSVTAMGDEAFYSCGSLVSVTVPGGILVLGNRCFYQCTSLVSVTLRTGILTIGEECFYQCTSLAQLRVPSGVLSIEKDAFRSCTSLKYVNLSNGLLSIGDGAFASCSSLVSINFLGLTAPLDAGTGWIEGTNASLRGHAFSASNLPAPGQSWFGLVMGEILASSVPDAPSDLSFSIGDGQVTLDWSAPDFNGGSPIDYYIIYKDGVDVKHSSSIPVTLTGLTNGVAYSFKIAAHNAIGTGPATEAVMVTTHTVPGAPTGLLATPGNSNVALSWSAPSNDGGGSIDYYIIYTNGVDTVHVAGTSVVMMSLNNGVSYSFAVCAHNAAGSGPLSPTVNAIPRTYPGAPIGLSAVFGDSRATLSWTEPSSDGGSGISYYAVYQDGVDVKHVAGTSTSIDGLTNGQSYSFYVRAYNTVGEGQESNVVQVTPMAFLPAIIGLSFISDTDSVTLTWVELAEADSYNIYYGTSSSSLTLIGDSINHQFTCGNLDSGRTYYFSVSGVSGIQEGTLSAPLWTTTLTYMTGSIVNMDGEPVNGVVVAIEDGNRTITTINGGFEMMVTPGNHLVTISGDGIDTLRRTVVVDANGTDIGTLFVVEKEGIDLLLTGAIVVIAISLAAIAAVTILRYMKKGRND